jgi:hypothetical protein
MKEVQTEEIRKENKRLYDKPRFAELKSNSENYSAYKAKQNARYRSKKGTRLLGPTTQIEDLRELWREKKQPPKMNH